VAIALAVSSLSCQMAARVLVVWWVFSRSSACRNPLAAGYSAKIVCSRRTLETSGSASRSAWVENSGSPGGSGSPRSSRSSCTSRARDSRWMSSRGAACLVPSRTRPTSHSKVLRLRPASTHSGTSRSKNARCRSRLASTSPSATPYRSVSGRLRSSRRTTRLSSAGSLQARVICRVMWLASRNPVAVIARQMSVRRKTFSLMARSAIRSR
jgi:hypothetical protein